MIRTLVEHSVRHGQKGSPADCVAGVPMETGGQPNQEEYNALNNTPQAVVYSRGMVEMGSMPFVVPSLSDADYKGIAYLGQVHRGSVNRLYRLWPHTLGV